MSKVKTILTFPAKLKTKNDRLGLIKFLQENIDNDIELLNPDNTKAEPDNFTCIGRVSFMVMEQKPVKEVVLPGDVGYKASQEVLDKAAEAIARFHMEGGLSAQEPPQPVHTPWQDQEP